MSQSGSNLQAIGILAIYKNSQMSSFDVVRQVKRVTGIKKIGHGGTLDPMAEGVLIVLLNEATGFFDYLLESSKIYETIIQLGKSTDTDDKEGVVIKESTVPDLTPHEINQKISDFTGDFLQIPPQYSALKIQGKKAYDLARSGETVVLDPRPVKVYSWENVSYDTDLKQISARIHCASGTYIRSLGRDLAKALGTEGHLIFLKRSQSGGVSEKQSLTLDNLSDWKNHLIAPEKALEFLPTIVWKGSYNHLLCGKPLTFNEQFSNGIYRLMYQEKIVALIEIKNQKISYKKNLAQCYQQLFI